MYNFQLETIGNDLRTAARTLVNSGAADGPFVATYQIPFTGNRLVSMYGPSIIKLALKTTNDDAQTSWWHPQDADLSLMARLARKAAANRKGNVERMNRKVAA